MKNFNQWALMICLLFFAGGLTAQVRPEAKGQPGSVIEKITSNPATGSESDYKTEGDAYDGSAKLYLAAVYKGKVASVTYQTYNIAEQYRNRKTVAAEAEVIYVPHLRENIYEIVNITLKDGKVITNNLPTFNVLTSSYNKIPMGTDLSFYTKNMEGDHVDLFISHYHIFNDKLREMEATYPGIGLADVVEAVKNPLAAKVTTVPDGQGVAVSCGWATYWTVVRFAGPGGYPGSNAGAFYHATPNQCPCTVVLGCFEHNASNQDPNAGNGQYKRVSGNPGGGDLILTPLNGNGQIVKSVDVEPCITDIECTQRGLTATATQPTCTNPTGTITVGMIITNMPTFAGKGTPDGEAEGVVKPSPTDGKIYYKFSINGGPYDTVTHWYNLPPGTYTITAIEVLPPVHPPNPPYCSAITSVTVTLSKGTSLTQPTLSKTDPTCAVATGSITVTNTQGGTEFQLDGGAWQSSTTFTNVTQGTHKVSTRNAAGCLSAPTSITLPVPPTPVAPALAKTDPTCAVPTGTITVTATNGTEYQLDGGAWQTAKVFTGVAPGTHTVNFKNTGGCISKAATITIPAVPVTTPPALAKTNPTCAVPTGTITVTATAGTQYQLDGGTWQTSNVFTGVAPGAHKVIFKNTAGCLSAPASITIPAVPNGPLAATLSKTDPTCVAPASGKITATGTGAVEYRIDGGAWQASNVFTGLSAGAHIVNFRNAAGCVSVNATITLTAPPTPAAASLTKTDPTCAVPTGKITATGTGATQYQLDGGAWQSSNIFTGVLPGAHTVNFKNAAGCTSAPATITIPDVPAGPSAPVLSKVDPTCTVATGTITVTNANGATQFQLDGGAWQTSTTFTNVAAGTHTVQSKNAAGCLGTPASITLPVVTGPGTPLAVTSVQPTCTVATGKFIITNYDPTATYTFSPAAGVAPSTPAGTYTAPAGTYTVTAKSAAGCTSATSANIVINAAPLGVTVTINSNQQPCSVDSVTLSATGADSYVWHSGSVTGPVEGTTAVIKVKPTLAANYYVVGTSGGCTGTASVLVQPVRPSLILTSIITICKGNTQDVIADGPGSTGIAGYTYRWLAPAAVAGVTTPTLTAMMPLVTTAYTVERTTPQGCKDTATSTIIVVEQPVIGTVTHTDASCTGTDNGSITINATSPTGNTLEYSINGTDWYTTNVFTNLAPGSYSVLVRNRQAPCGAVSGTSVTIVRLSGIMSSIVGPDRSCANEETRFDASPVVIGATYAWSSTNNAAAGVAAPVVTGDAVSPSYILAYATNNPATQSRAEVVTLTITLNGCSATYTHPINITQGIFANAGPDTSVCKGGQVFIGLPANQAGPLGATFQWAPADKIQGTTTASQFTTVGLTADQEYSLTVTDPNNGCTRTDKVYVTVNTNKNPVADAGLDGILGAGQTMTLGGAATSQTSATAIVSYTWTKVSGTTGTLDDATDKNPLFTMATPAADHLYGLDVRMQYRSTSTTPGLVCHAYDTVKIVTNIVSAVPDLTPTLTILPSTIVGDNNVLECRIRVREVNNVSTTTMGVYVSIPTSTHYTILPYDPTLTTSAGSAVQNSNWKYYGIINGNYFFQYIGSTLIGANGSSALGFSINYNANHTAGKEYVVVSIADGSGGENNFLNNKDEEVIIYGADDDDPRKLSSFKKP